MARVLIEGIRHRLVTGGTVSMPGASKRQVDLCQAVSRGDRQGRERLGDAQ